MFLLVLINSSGSRSRPAAPSQLKAAFENKVSSLLVADDADIRLLYFYSKMLFVLSFEWGFSHCTTGIPQQPLSPASLDCFFRPAQNPSRFQELSVLLSGECGTVRIWAVWSFRASRLFIYFALSSLLNGLASLSVIVILHFIAVFNDRSPAWPNDFEFPVCGINEQFVRS